MSLEASAAEFVRVLAFELTSEGLSEARLAFNCEDVYVAMAQAARPCPAARSPRLW